MKYSLRLVQLAMAVVVPGVSASQNLVPNGSFEDYTQCPSNFSQIERAVGWMPFRVTPDYYNSCSPNDSAGVPLNFFGYQTAATGQAYAGLGCYGNPPPPNIREYLGIALTQPLAVGQPVYLSFKTVFASSGVSQFYLPQFNCTGVGLRFAMNPQSGGALNPNNAAIHLDQLIVDTVGWTTISGVYTPDSAYEYLVVGNFFDDQGILVDQFNPGGNFAVAYFYVDDVCVTYDPMGCVFAQGAEEQPRPEITIGPNPFSDEIWVLFNPTGPIAFGVSLVDVLGKVVELPGRYWSGDRIRLPYDIPDGTYLLRLQRDEKSFASCRIVHRSP